MRQLLMDLPRTPSKKISDLNQTLDKSILRTGCDKFVILASNLKFVNQKLLRLVAIKHKFKILSTYRYLFILFIYYFIILFFFLQ